MAMSKTKPISSVRVTLNTVNPTEVVHRPEPGLARGIIEAPPLAFALILLVVLACLSFFGLLNFMRVFLRKR